MYPILIEVVESVREFIFTPSITQSLLWLTIVMTIGLWLGEKAKIKHFSLGVTWVLFVGIAMASMGVQTDHSVAQFAKDFGLILFVYSIGLQVGPSFAPFKRSGLQLNMLAAAIVLFGCVCAIVLHYITGIDMSTMAGIMSGATTSTPSLAAAQQAYQDLTGSGNPDIATGYAVAYPLSIVGVILALELIRRACKVHLPEEEKRLRDEAAAEEDEPVCVDVKLNNPQLDVLTLNELMHLCPVKEMVVSRVIRPDGSDELVNEQTTFRNGDTLRILTDKRHTDALRLLGQLKDYNLRVQKEKSDHLISRRIAVTRPECNGKRIRTFNLRQQYHATITRVSRAGIDLLATPDMVLQLGDRLMVVGDKDDVQRVANTFGNELKRLDAPHLLPVFFGIVLGICVGLLPIPLPGMGTTFKLGLVGGSLIVALLIGHYGPYYNMVTFSTTSANMMLRQVGLTLFLAALGLSVGEGFVPTLVNGGYLWIGYGFIITIVPLLTIGILAYKWLHVNYFKVTGLLIGAMTSAMALPYAQSLSNENNQASVCYATVYPFTTFLRVMAGQLLVLLFCSFTSADSVQTPVLLPGTVNSLVGEEYGPVLTIDDNTLYFVGLNRDEANMSEDIYVSRRDRKTGEWGNARKVPEFSNPYRNEAPTSVSGDGRTMLLFVEGRMCFSQRGPHGWSEPMPMPRYLQLGNWQADAQISADGAVMLFAANYPAEGEKKASLNIFVSERDAQGRWSKPFSIGPAVNTRGMERSPFLHPDMKTLYFSSDREGTAGDLDVWVTRRLSDSCWNCWSEPENLGTQINTPGRDCWYKISADGKTAFYAMKSGRKHDIYSVTLPEDKRPETITVLRTNEPVAINNLLFETASDVIMESSLPELKRIAAFVRTYGYKVRLAGHTDNIGQPDDNRKLSQARAESVRKQLIAYGCAPEKITAVGYGDLQPVADNGTEEGRQQNRRVEITLSN
ncbi:MAG: putative transporter [Paludibacteraceae bacterium]|nr:putative transporter [Paludibacteraceae bacterium]